MATLGEIKWASVIGRNDEFRSIFRQGEFMFIRFQWGSSQSETEEQSVATFSLPKVRLSTPARISINVTLIFRAFRLGARFPEEYKVRMRWVPTWIPEKSGFTAVFFPNPDRVFLLLPITTSSTGKLILGPADLLFAGFLNSRGELMPNRLLPVIRERVPRTLRSIKHATVFDHSFSDLGKFPTSPVTYSAVLDLGSETATQPYSFTSQPYVKYHRSFTSVRTLGFRSLPKSQLPVNPFSCVIRKTDNQQGFLRRYHNTIPSGWEQKYVPSLGGLTPGDTLIASHDATVANRAIGQLIRRMDRDVESNIALNLLQIDQTARLIAHSAKRITKSIRQLKRGNLSAAADALFEGPTIRRSQYKTFERKGGPSKTKDLASNWLELQYGWKPLLSDIDGAMRLLADSIRERPPWRVVRGTAALTDTYVDQVLCSDPGAPVFSTLVNRQNVKYSASKIVVKYGLDSARSQYLQQTGFTSPLNLFWEILPYSFVVDWFLPIGPYLETLNAFDGLTFIDGSHTYFTRHGQLCYIDVKGGTTPGNPNNVWTIKGGYSRESIAVDRLKLTAFPRKTVGFKSPLSVGHALNAVALLRVAFR